MVKISIHGNKTRKVHRIEDDKPPLPPPMKPDLKRTRVLSAKGKANEPTKPQRPIVIEDDDEEEQEEEKPKLRKLVVRATPQQKRNPLQKLSVKEAPQSFVTSGSGGIEYEDAYEWNYDTIQAYDFV